MTNLPPEELIVIVSGGARKIVANFDSNPPLFEEITPELTINVTNDAGNVIDILDKATDTPLPHVNWMQRVPPKLWDFYLKLTEEL